MTLQRAPASRRLPPPGQGAPGSRALARVLALAACALLPAAAWPTPTTVFRAPSAAVQPFGTVHFGYDTRFWPGSARAAAHPVVVGLTAGILPYDRLQLEAGFDAVLPSPDPVFLNAKLGSAEGALFPGSPAWAVGIFEAGVTRATALDVAYAVVGKRTPLGSFGAGGYVGSARLLRSSAGAGHRAGFLGSVALAPLAVNRPWLDRVEVRWDVITGRNAIGATGGGIALLFTPAVALLTGPVFYADPALQPGAAGFAWSVQVDVDLDFRARRAPASDLPGATARPRALPARSSR